MFPTHRAALLLAIAGLQSGAAGAQVPPAAPASATATRPDPADPKALVPAIAYRSTLGAFPALSELKVAPWRDTNDAVRQRGGWRAYAREAATPEAAEASPIGSPAGSTMAPSPASAPAATGHSGHTTK